MSIYQLINKINLSIYEEKMIQLATNCLESQTNLWHINSPKKVACCIYLKIKNDFIVAQNIGISKVTGSFCAERSAITVAVAKYPDLKFDEITDIFIIGENNPILPCGVCCEWLYKINPLMNLYTLKQDKVVKVKLLDYYIGDSIDLS